MGMGPARVGLGACQGCWRLSQYSWHLLWYQATPQWAGIGRCVVDLNLPRTALAPRRRSWVWEELTAVRNIRPGFRAGLIPGLLHAALDAYVLRGKEPWTLRHG